MLQDKLLTNCENKPGFKNKLEQNQAKELIAIAKNYIPKIKDKDGEYLKMGKKSKCVTSRNEIFEIFEKNPRYVSRCIKVLYAFHGVASMNIGNKRASRTIPKRLLQNT